MGVFNPKGIIALSQKDLIVTTTILMLIVVIPVFVLLASFTWRYRATNMKATYSPEWSGSVILESIWWAIPTAIIAALGIITWFSTQALDPYKPIVSNVVPITIEVVALDWKWLFIYPDYNMATVNFVQFPKDTPINFKITGDSGAMNSFWIPQLAGQIYAMPGMNTKLHLMASETGEYRGLSANYSGLGFSGMRFMAKASSQQEFDIWVDEVRQSPTALSLDEYTVLQKKSKNNPTSTYFAVEENLYGKIIMKYMAPAMDQLNSAHQMEI